MGLLGVARNVKRTILMGLALFGFYFLLASFNQETGVPDATVGLFLLATLVLYGLFTDAAVTALLTTGGVVFVWLLAASGNPDHHDEFAAGGLRLYLKVLLPTIATGVGVLVRAWLHRDAETKPAPVLKRGRIQRNS